MNPKTAHLRLPLISACFLSSVVTLPVLASDVLEETIVTAQKRTASLQDVPITITAFNSDAIRDLNITAIKDLQSYTPGLNIVQSNPSRTRVRIRGIGSSKFDVGSEPSVGIFIDEIYMPRLSGGDFSLLDIERIEVLKGPQGTLFGRNTAGGAISILSTKPSDTFEGYIEGGLANKDSSLIRGSVSGPVTDNLRMRLSAGTEELGGFGENQTTGNTNDDRSSAARWQVAYDVAEDLNLSGSLAYNKQKMKIIKGESLGILPGNQALPLLSPPAPPFPFTPTYVTPDPFAEPLNHDGGLNADSTMATFRIEKSFDGIEFVSLSGYRESNLDLTEDFERTSLDVALAKIKEDSNTYSQEFRLLSENWLAGIYLYQDDAHREDGFNWLSGSIPYRIAGGMDSFDNMTVKVETTSWAVFGEYVFHLADAWALTLGGRYTDDSKDVKLSATTTTPGVPVVAVPYTHKENLNWDSFDPKVNLTYQPSDAVLFFATYSTGFKSGGVQFTASSEFQARQTFDPEELDAYEMGFKSEILQQTLRLNGSVFYYDYKNLQQQRVVVDGPSASAVTTNAGKSEVKGAELDLRWIPFEQATVSLGYNYLDAEFTDYDDGDGNDFSGNPLPNTPKNTVSLIVDYDFTLPGDWGVTVGTAWYWSDKQNFDVQDNDPYTELDSYYTGSARINIMTPSEKLNLELYVENMTDEDYDKEILRRAAEILYTPIDGRRYGVRLQYLF